MFNMTGERNSENMLSELMKCNFDIVLFVPNVAHAKKDAGNYIMLTNLIHLP